VVSTLTMPPGLTRSIAEFISRTRTRDIPADVIELGRKSILDGFGLALAGSVTESGKIIADDLGDLCAGGKRECTVLVVKI
jgi:2-methylcitrate dehydratase PrpD